MPLSREEIAERFSSITPTEELAEKLRELRENFTVFAEVLNDELPECRAKDLAMTHLEDTAMWAIKALSREPVGYELSPEVEAQLSGETPEGTGPEGSDGSGAGSH